MCSFLFSSSSIQSSVNQGYSSDSSTLCDIPSRRSTDKSKSKWSIEEEYIFFEGHSLLGNKWTFISHLFHNKSAKQMKNHFYSSIVKTLRKIYKNKLDFDMKEIIITYYSLIYLKKLFSNNQFMYMIQNNVNCQSVDTKNVTLKKYIINHHIDYSKIISFEAEFEKTTKEKLNEYLSFLSSFTSSSIPNIFNALVKVKLLYKSIAMLKNKGDRMISSNNKNSLENFINCFLKVDE